MTLDMDHILMVLMVLLWNSEPDVRLVGGSSRCTGTLELKHEGEWRPVYDFNWSLKEAAVICRELDCGSVVSAGEKKASSNRVYMWRMSSDCVQSGSVLRDCIRPSVSTVILELTCSDSVRLVNGTTLCSGRLEVRSNQSNQSWSSVCEADFDQQDAEVVCRELGCGAPSVLQGALYGDVEAPMWTKEFQCGGHESALLDCRSSGSARNTCSPGKAVGLTCSEPVRLVGGSSRCAGTLEVKLGDWRPVAGFDWTLKEAAVLCRDLDCGSAVSIRQREESSDRPVWRVTYECIQSGSALRDCVTSDSSFHIPEITCSDSVRLVNGTTLCSGRLEVRSNQSNQSWSSVCEADFDQQDAEVVCRELSCGAPSVLQGALYGEVEAPMWTKEFQCGGHESALLDCRSSGSARNTCSPGKAVGLTCSDQEGFPVRLVGGSSRCAGTLEVKLGDWRPVNGFDWTLKEAAVLCRDLDCGSAVSTRQREESSSRPVWGVSADCVQSGSVLRDCMRPNVFPVILELTCSDSVRLVNGTTLCSGRLEVRTNQSNQSWSSVCEADFDQQDAEVVCRELSCGAPSVLQGALYGDVEAPMWTKEFQCGGHESALLDCRSSGSARNTCSPGKAVGLTCSEPVRLVGGSSRCAGTLEVKLGDWRPVAGFDWTLKEAAVLCRDLDCGSAVSTRQREESSSRPVWGMSADCVQSGSVLRDCVTSYSSFHIPEITCSDSVRLVNGTTLCSGRLEVRSNQSNQSWSSVCEADFDQQDAEVVCRELGCGASSVLQGALYGDVEAPMWTKEFQCGGHESALLDCRSSGSARNTCSPGKAVGLTCSEPVRLVGGSSRCAGTLEVKLGDWRPVAGFDWTLKEAAVLCRDLDCGSAVSTRQREESSDRPVWRVTYECIQSGSALRDCVTSDSSFHILEITCSDSVRLVNGTTLCSGRLEVRSNQSNQSWSSVCEADFDQQDAEVVCRELGCGAPSVLQGALYGDVEAPMWTKEFQCGGHESALLDCRSSGSARNTCSPGKAVGLTCSEPVRLVGGSSRCAGTLEVKHQGDWRPVDDLNDDWTLKEAAVLCRDLDCGSAVSIAVRDESSDRPVWGIRSECIESASALRDCITPYSNFYIPEITCSDLLVQPDISVSSSMDGVSEAQQQRFQVIRGSNFTVSCIIEPQYPGGSFHLTFTSSNSAHNYTQPAVNHSAHFLFPAADPSHQGSYSCVYRIYVFSHNFSSESRLLSVTVSRAFPPVFIFALVLLLLSLTLYITAISCSCTTHVNIRRHMGSSNLSPDESSVTSVLCLMAFSIEVKEKTPEDAYLCSPDSTL
ncbi:scavenger receptor cysteine-rich type 1 protein M130-like [Enoplosus armatus]|uniref:scavenger receptor cysteine-rich type 1 protein M130-like n=1 Tax=Enoplosus armatus TaxID=215367 RepID=UPI00399243E7